MTKLIEAITAAKDEVKRVGDLASPHIGNAISALDAATFHLRNESHRQQQEEAKEPGKPSPGS